MPLNRPWRVVAGAGAAAVITGLGATVAAASDGFELRDRGDLVDVKTVNLDSGASAESADSPGESPFDSTDSPAFPDSPGSPDPPDSPDSLDSIDSP